MSAETPVSRVALQVQIDRTAMLAAKAAGDIGVTCGTVRELVAEIDRTRTMLDLNDASGRELWTTIRDFWSKVLAVLEQVENS
jgi:hypothetical protein